MSKNILIILLYSYFITSCMANDDSSGTNKKDPDPKPQLKRVKIYNPGTKEEVTSKDIFPSLNSSKLLKLDVVFGSDGTFEQTCKINNKISDCKNVKSSLSLNGIETKDIKANKTYSISIDDSNLDADRTISLGFKNYNEADVITLIENKNSGSLFSKLEPADKHPIISFIDAYDGHYIYYISAYINKDVEQYIKLPAIKLSGNFPSGIESINLLDKDGRAVADCNINSSNISNTACKIDDYINDVGKDRALIFKVTIASKANFEKANICSFDENTNYKDKCIEQGITIVNANNSSDILTHRINFRSIMGMGCNPSSSLCKPYDGVRFSNPSSYDMNGIKLYGDSSNNLATINFIKSQQKFTPSKTTTLDINTTEVNFKQLTSNVFKDNAVFNKFEPSCFDENAVFRYSHVKCFNYTIENNDKVVIPASSFMLYADTLPINSPVPENHYICAPDISLSSDYTQSNQDLKCGVIVKNSQDYISYWLPDSTNSLEFSVSNNVIRIYWHLSK
jgi:hypothetical protein